MHPVSTVLFLAGYALAIPIALKMGAVVAQQHRTALIGHQIGVIVAGLGWVLRGRIVVALIHVAWMIGVRLWFANGARAERSARSDPA